MKLWESGNISRKTLMESYNLDVEMEYEQKKREADAGYDEVFAKPGTTPVEQNAEEPEGDAKIGRPKMDEDERNSDENNAATGAQPKPSRPEGSESQDDQ